MYCNAVGGGRDSTRIKPKLRFGWGPNPNLVTTELLHSMDMSLEGMFEQTPPPQGREEVPWGNPPPKHKIWRQTQVTKKSFQWQGCGFHIWYMIRHARTVT